MLKIRAISEEELMRLSAMNPELRFERNGDGGLVAAPPRGWVLGNREAKAISRLMVWVEDHDLGEVFGSSSGFRLPNGAVRSPDTAFIAKARLPEAWDQQQDEYIDIVPDFVIEIRSQNDSLTILKEKMQEYIEQGVQLGWLVDRNNKAGYVYRADGSVTQYPATVVLSGDEVVPGFEFKLSVLL